jgi:hypothetical protein
MTREEITATLRAVDPDSDHDCYMAAPVFVPAANLIDKQARRIADLEAALVVMMRSAEAPGMHFNPHSLRSARITLRGTDGQD